MNIRAFFETVITQNRKILPTYFHDDAIICWPCTNEKFTLEEYIRANCEYPGSWKGEIERYEEYVDGIILIAHVYSSDTTISCHVVSFIKIRDGKIEQMDEYWGDDGEVPKWRQDMCIGRKIK